MPINEQTVYETIERKLSQWVDSLPDPYKPIIGSAGTGDFLSPMDLLDQVRNHTEQGNWFVERWHQLALEHIINSAFEENEDEELEEFGTSFSFDNDDDEEDLRYDRAKGSI
jgi:hypothetical protein